MLQLVPVVSSTVGSCHLLQALAANGPIDRWPFCTQEDQYPSACCTRTVVASSCIGSRSSGETICRCFFAPLIEERAEVGQGSQRNGHSTVVYSCHGAKRKLRLRLSNPTRHCEHIHSYSSCWSCPLDGESVCLGTKRVVVVSWPYPSHVRIMTDLIARRALGMTLLYTLFTHVVVARRVIRVKAMIFLVPASRQTLLVKCTSMCELTARKRNVRLTNVTSIRKPSSQPPAS